MFVIEVLIKFAQLGKKKYEWVPVSLTGKVFNGWIRDLGFNPCLHQKPIDVLV